MFNSIFSFFSSNYLKQKGQSFSCLLRLFHLLHFLQKKLPEVFCKEDVFSDFATFTESTCAKETLAQVFAVNCVKFLRTSFFIKHHRWLLLEPRKLFTISGIFQVQSFPSLNQKITLIHIDS